LAVGLGNGDRNRRGRFTDAGVIELHGAARLEWRREWRDRQHDEPYGAELEHNASDAIRIDR